MKGRMKAGRYLALLGASCTVAYGMSACGPRAEDINRVQPGYVRKAIFQTDDEWYYRRTIVKSETTNAIAVEGHGDIFLDRVKWEIQENYVIAYKPYEAIPGSQTQEWEGNDSFKGGVVGMWPVTSHFDIQRGYDPSTGNTTNTIDENHSDRPWYEREYMRVDWASNQIDGGFLSQYAFGWVPVKFIATGSYWTDLATRPTDPFASRFSDDYVEYTDHVLLGMDLFTCAAFGGYSLAHFDKCGFGEAKVRNSFVRITEPSDYIPRDYPDSVVRKGADGKPIYDADTGEVVREPIHARFGFFRLETPTYDRGYGTTESGRLFRAMTFNIWKRHTDDNGNEIAMRDREPKPIIYYLNAEYPERYRQTAAEVEAEYDRVFSQTVADVKGISLDQLKGLLPNGKMFEIRDNDCNAANITQFVQNNPDYTFAVERAVCREGEACMQPLDKVGLGNLKNVCTSLEAATLDPETGKSEFSWQRIGDPRYSMVVWLANPQDSGWGGYGPMHADGRTGETVAATSFLRGFAYERRAADVVDFIEFMNDEKSVEEIIYGQDVRRQMAETLRRKGAFTSAKASTEFMNRIETRMHELGSTRAELLREIPNRNMQLDRLARVRNTRLEEPLITDMDLMMASEGSWIPNAGLEVTDDVLYRASPVGRVTEGNPFSDVRTAARNALASAGYCFLEQDFDPVYAGLAFDLKDLPREERYNVVANRMIKHVMLHELGHNVGFLHNFEGSYDALNYNDEFWKWHWGTEEEKVQNSYEGYKNTTVMEYMSSKGLFSDYLGKYDEAAIRFGYANQVQVFSSGSVDPSLEGGLAMKDWRYLNDYRKIPDHLCGTAGCADNDVRRDVIKARGWVEFDPQNPPANEVPYLFCDNSYSRMTPFCATFDYGANMREIFANYYSWWSDYFFFNNFDRDRLFPLGWWIGSGLMPTIYTMDFIDNVGQYLYYLSASNPQFRNTDLAEDMATTVAHGLNFAAEVISTPEPIRMCPWPGLTNPKVYIPWYFLDSCDEYADLSSQYAIDAEAIQVPLGDARPATLGFSRDYEDWYFRFVGSFFDKSNVLVYLGLNRSRFFRFNYDLDVRNYDLSLFRLFETELRNFYENLIAFDYFYIRSTTATDLGSYWCRDQAEPNKAYLGRFEPRRLVDPVQNLSLPGPSADCQDPAAIYPTLLASMPFVSMLVSHALFSSDFDSELDMGKSLKVYVVGADDDFITWDALSPCETAPAGQNCYCSMTDALTGLEYRSIIQSEGIEGVQDIPSLGCRLIDYATQAQDNYLGGNGSPWEKDNWRQWIERLEYARDLYREFHLR